MEYLGATMRSGDLFVLLILAIIACILVWSAMFFYEVYKASEFTPFEFAIDTLKDTNVVMKFFLLFTYGFLFVSMISAYLLIDIKRICDCICKIRTNRKE